MANQLTSNRAYRLYAGHGNWINLNAQTTKDLLDIFTKGVPTRYQLAPGLSIDIIPHDVDCNSKNIDMLGLMRADLVYDSDESVTQQRMSNYIRDILDEQGIIDAFPPTKPDEELPPITSLPTHRHLSLVPSVAGSIRRGPKSSQGYASKSGPLRKRVATSPSRRSLKKPRQQKNEPLKKIILPLSSNLHSDTNNSYPMVNSHSQHHPSDLCMPSSSSSTYQLNPAFSLSASLHPSSTSDEMDGQLNLQKLSPMMFLNEYEHDFSSQKDPVLSSYYPCSSTSSSSAVTSATVNQLLERQQQQQQQSFPEENSPLDEPMMPSSCWVNVHSNDVKDDEQWISSIEYSRKDSNCSTNSHVFMHEPIMATRPFDNRSSMDQNYYFNDSSKSTTGPTSPSDFDDMTTLPQNMKHIVMQSRVKQ